MKLWWLGLHWFVCKNGHMLPTGSLVIMCIWGERFCPTCLAKGWDMRMSTSSPPPWRNMRISDHKDGQCLKPIIDLHSWYLVALPMFVIVHFKECEERKKEAKNKNKECSPRASVPQWPHSIRRGCNISGQILQEPPYFGIFAEMGNVQIVLPEKCERWFIS